MNRIAICSFCNSKYKVRPQVKNPKACYKKTCQLNRQRKNEKDWVLKNKNLYDGKYHKIKRQVRMKKLKAMVEEILEMIKVGKIYLNKKINIEFIKGFLFKFIYKFGIRSSNKLWNIKKDIEINILQEVLEA
jgi:hypothetical protein